MLAQAPLSHSQLSLSPPLQRLMNAPTSLRASRSPSPAVRLAMLRRQSDIVSQTLSGKPAIDRHGPAARRNIAPRRQGRGPKCIKKGKDGGAVWPAHLFHLFCLAVGMVKSEQQNGKQSKERQNEAIAQWYLKLTGLSRSAQQVASHLQQCRKWYDVPGEPRWDESLEVDEELLAATLASPPRPGKPSPAPSSTSSQSRSSSMCMPSPTTSCDLPLSAVRGSASSPARTSAPSAPVPGASLPTFKPDLMHRREILPNPSFDGALQLAPGFLPISACVPRSIASASWPTSSFARSGTYIPSSSYYQSATQYTHHHVRSNSDGTINIPSHSYPYQQAYHGPSYYASPTTYEVQDITSQQWRSDPNSYASHAGATIKDSHSPSPTSYVSPSQLQDIQAITYHAHSQHNLSHAHASSPHSNTSSHSY